MASGKKGQASRVIVWVILLLLIVGLTGFGVRNFGATVRSVGSVGDTEIEVDRFARALNQELRAFSAQLGRNVPLSEARQLGIDSAVLGRLIGAVARENEAARLGISLGDGEVRRQIVTTQAFAGSDGAFDRDTYEFVLQQSGLTPATYEETLRVETARNILENAVAAGFTVPSAYSDTIISFVAERRDFSWLKLDERDLKGPVPEPEETDLRTYYDENTDEFMLPETRRITYAWLTPAMLAERIEVSDADLKVLYEERRDEYVIPERRLIEQLVYATPQEAEAARAALDDGTSTFEELVAARGLTLNDVDMGDVAAADLGDAADAVFGPDEPGIVGPVETELGPSLFRVNAILAPRTTSFEAARPELREELVADRARRQIADGITGMDDLLAGGATLEELARETELELGTIDWTEASDQGIAAYQAFAEAAATTEPEDFPQITELEDGGVFALRVDEVLPARPEPFEDVRDRVAAAWRSDRMTEMLADQAVELKSRVEAGASLSALGYPVTVETAIRRDAFIEDTPPALVAAVFEIDEGQTIVQTGVGEAFVVHLNAIRPPDEADPDVAAMRLSLAGSMAQGLSQDALTAYTVAIQSDAGISINQAALNAVYAQFP